MKKLLISLIILFLLSSCTSKQNEINHKIMDENNLLDGTSLTYIYHDLGTVKLDFTDGLITYEWLEGPFKGTIGKDHPYKSKKIAKKIYLVHWFESSRSSLVSLVINFKEDSVDSSALLNPTTEEETVLFHHATIQKQKLVEK